MKHLTLQGSHFDLGFSWGQALAQQGHFVTREVPFPLTEQRSAFARASIGAYKRFYPATLEEIRGFSMAQGCSTEDLQAILFPMYALLPSPCCSCFALPGLLGRNSDFLAAQAEACTNLICRPDGAIPFTGNTTSFLQMEDGCNHKGLAIGLTSVFTPAPRPGLTAGLVLRLLLETCENVAQALDTLKVLPLGSNQTFTLADRGGEVALVECGPDGLEVLSPGKDRYVAAVNRFRRLPCPLPPGWDDWRSAERLDTLEGALGTCGGALEVSGAQDILAGRRGFLCQYDPAGGQDTLWSVIYDVMAGAVYRADGNPGRTPFREDRRFKPV